MTGQSLTMTPDGAIPPVGPLGIKVASMDFFLDPASPVRWKGPMDVSPVWLGLMEMNVIREFLADVMWGELDYLLADPVVIPAEVRSLFAEKIHDLPALITIEPPPQIPPSPLPMLANGYVTFGVFNRADKISDSAISVWSRLLQAVPGAVIVMKHSALDDALVRDALIARFVASGIPEDRLRCIGASPRGEHLKLVSTIDIMLDPFPQNGGISTWEPLQLGVPVVSKLGNGHASRCGGAIVIAAGLDDWVAQDEEGYIEIAKRWASNPEELAALRARLPQQVLSSAAGNSVTYTRHVEVGYRKFWRDYCASASG